MLVLSRKEEQQIVFPHLGIEINVIQVRGRLVKLGVNAPQSVKVLRSELVNHQLAEEQAPEPELTHRQRNDLNLLNLRVANLHRRLHSGEEIDAQQALTDLLREYTAIDHTVQGFDDASPDDHAIRLLVVEDSDNERELMAYLLASHGFEVRVACDGLSALDQLLTADFQPDFVLMDMQMPHANGLETLLQIRQDERLRHLKVFAVTGAARDTQSEPLEHGWDDWFQKPVEIDRLVATLRRDSARQKRAMVH